MFSSPRSNSSRSSHHQGPTSPPFPPSPHPELVASPKSLAADVFERVSARSYGRSSASVTPAQSPFPKGVFPRPESSLYYTASLRSFGGDSEAFGGEINTPGSVSASAAAPANFSRAKVSQPQNTAGGIGVLSALLESSRRRGGTSGETQFLQRRYTEEWIRRYQRPAINSSSPEGDQAGAEDEEADGDDDEDEDDDDDDEINIDSSKKGHRRRNHSNAKTITQADIATILREATPIPPELDGSATEELSDIDGVYIYYKTAPQSMAGTVSTDAPSVPSISRNSMRGTQDIINRPASTVSYNGTVTPTAASSYLAPIKPPTRTNSRASVRWNGKNVIISIPLEIRDENGVDISTGRPLPLTKEEVLERLRAWESMGYNIETRDVYGDNGQSREIYPEERHGPVDKSEVYVNIPDRRGETYPTQSLIRVVECALGYWIGVDRHSWVVEDGTSSESRRHT